MFRYTDEPNPAHPNDQIDDLARWMISLAVASGMCLMLGICMLLGLL